MGDTLFKGKFVAIIGPAPHIVEKERYFGHFDLVCRINHGVKMPDVVRKATGDRCDVWYAADKYMAEQSILGSADYVKYIRAGKSRKAFLDPKVKHKFSEMHGFLSPARKLLKCEPNRGMKAIIDILIDKPDHLHIAGFTFYQGGNPYFSGYCSKMGEKLNSARNGNVGNHKQEPQLDLFVTLIWRHPKVTVDYQLNEICKRWIVQDTEMTKKREWKWLRERIA